MTKGLKSLIFVASLAGMPATAGFAESLAGNYLAATQANYNSDYKSAARFYTRALTRDPDNTHLMQNILYASLAAGDMKQSLPIARRMLALDTDQTLANLMLLTEAVGKGEFDAAMAIFDDGAEFSPLLDALIKAWILLGKGQLTDATAVLDGLATGGSANVFGEYHKALILAMAGDFEGADEILRGEDGENLRISRGSLAAHVQILSQLDRQDDALALVDSILANSRDAQFVQLRERLIDGETLPYDFITSAEQGAAEVFYTLSSVLSGDQNDRFSLIYGRLAEYLRPDSVDALLLVAELLEEQGQHDLAVATYNKVPADHPIFYSAEIGRADALMAADKPEAAIEVLRGLTNTHGNIPSVFISLGDALRRQSNFAEATLAYDDAIALLPEPQANQWFLYYARAITYEREGEWEKAEKDFRFSLELSPDQPLVLNYLGYGMVEKRINLEEAQAMIETAVEKRPNDGYITDSLGWVLYRVEKFEEAVPHLERAVELQPVDPIINDHLGDAYWMVGRKLEADFQWRRALSFEPEEADAERIRQKLAEGLDVVLKIEADLAAASNDN